MEADFLKFLTESFVATNIGPDAKEILLQQAEDDFANGKMGSSIFYQTFSLYQASQERYNRLPTSGDLPKHSEYPPVQTLMEQMNADEISEFDDNILMQYIKKSLSEIPQKAKHKTGSSSSYESCNFLKDVTNPSEGLDKLTETCQRFPEEWTIIQLCKGARTDTTFSIFNKIHESDAPMYMTLLKHARSQEYPTPLCIRVSNDDQKALYESFGCIINRFKQCVKIDPKEVNTTEAKRYYWSLLGELNNFIASACADLCKFFYPWTFLFSGIPCSGDIQRKSKERWATVDEFCNIYKWKNDARILLSLAASNVENLDLSQIDDICSILTTSQSEQKYASDMLKNMPEEQFTDGNNKIRRRNYPCILIVDERLDHFFWEEINVYQEFTRINSVQCLWRLYSYYKSQIKSGYLCVDIKDGGCLINPDNNLPKMESRMVSFFKYWMPHWTMLVGQRPTTQDELLNKYLSRSCYVYAGHGSGLQYINGRKITKHQLHCVVFLFGCDSSRLHSSGLYSELVGPHIYYQAAMCWHINAWPRL